MNRTDGDPRQFIEDMGDLMDEHGMPHMAGRVIGALLVSDPPHRSLDELAEELQASKGAISMSTQLLIRLGIIEKISIPGERRRYYRVQPGIWSELFLRRDEHVDRHRHVAEAGLALLADKPIEARMRLLEMLVFFDFIAQELPGFEKRWSERRGELMKRRVDANA